MKTYPTTDRYQRHWFPHPITGEEQPFTRATTWAKTISDTYGLELWKNRQVARGVAMREDLQALAAALRETDESEKKELNEVVEQAINHAAPSAGANVGDALHKWTERVDRGEEVVIDPRWAPDVDAYSATLEKYGVHAIPNLIERYVCLTNPMDVAGRFDRIIEWDGGWYIADVKTQANLDYSWNEIAVQLALYSHAEYIWDPLAPIPGENKAAHWDDMPVVNKQQGLIIHLPAKQAKCELWWVDLEAGWRAAMLAMEVREWRKRKDIARPFGVDLLGRSPVHLVENVSSTDGDSPAADHGDGEIAARGSAPNGPSTPPDVVPAGDQGKLT